MALTVDDLRRIDGRARERVERVRRATEEAVTLPARERRELQEYQALTNEEHGRLMQWVGPEKYQEYVDEMERLRLRHGGS